MYWDVLDRSRRELSNEALLGGKLTHCRKEKKEEIGENTNQKAPEDFPDWKIQNTCKIRRPVGCLYAN